MCGICGFSGPGTRENLVTMTDTMAHRGPDASGYHWEPGLGIGHRRLKIIDLSDAAAQPMAGADGNLVLTFNGEIYNYRALRGELAAAGRRFVSLSDTEVLLAAYERWGAACVDRLHGMFAFGVADRRAGRIFLARDRFGKKPLYYWHRDGLFIFASELKAIIAHPAVARRLNHRALRQYLLFEYVPEPESIFDGIRKLPGGHTLNYAGGQVKVSAYWDCRFTGDYLLPANEETLCGELRGTLQRAVTDRLMSDVPLGVFLSGGIDSSTVVALLAEKISPAEIKTFAVGFREASFDESAHARRVAEHFGTDHHEEQLDPRAMVDIIPEIFSRLDEPFADASIIPTYLLAKFTRQHVTVVLGGDGGDELFCGYDPFRAHYFLRGLRLPGAVTGGLGRLADKLLPVSDVNMSRDFIVKKTLRGLAYDTLRRNQVWLGAFTPDAQAELLEGWREEMAAEVFAPATSLPRGGTTLLQQVSYQYVKLYLQGDILTKIDRASMLNSLEVRSPFLDTEFAAFACRLPDHCKIRRGVTKYLLKQAMRDKLPPGITDRKKKGFGIPLARWFRHELRQLLGDMIDSGLREQAGLFRAAYVRRLLDEHLRGTHDHRKELWTLLVFFLWGRAFRPALA